MRDLHKVREQEGVVLSLTQLYALVGLLALAMGLTFILGFYVGRKAPPAAAPAEDPLVPSDVQNDSVALLLARAAEEEAESTEKESQSPDLQFHDILPSRTGEEGEAPRPSASAAAPRSKKMEAPDVPPTGLTEGGAADGDVAPGKEPSVRTGSADKVGPGGTEPHEASATEKEVGKADAHQDSKSDKSTGKSGTRGDPASEKKAKSNDESVKSEARKESRTDKDSSSDKAPEKGSARKDARSEKSLNSEKEGSRSEGHKDSKAEKDIAKNEGHKDSRSERESRKSEAHKDGSLTGDDHKEATGRKKDSVGAGDSRKAEAEKGGGKSPKAGARDSAAELKDEKPKDGKKARELERGEALSDKGKKAKDERALESRVEKKNASKDEGPDKGGGKGYTVQVSSYQEASVADKLVRQLGAQGFGAYKVAAEVNGHTWYRVRIGSYDNRDGAEKEMQRLKAARSELNPMIAHR